MVRDRDEKRRIIITALILGAVALGFYVAIFIRHWS